MLATCGCEQSNESEGRARAPDKSDTVPQSETSTGIAAQNNTSMNQEAEATEVAARQAELAAIQSQHAALRIERERISTLLESHQAEGEKKLAALKAQWKEFDGAARNNSDQAASREEFAERARVEMESALMMDQEYRAQLQETDDKLRESQKRMRELSERETP